VSQFTSVALLFLAIFSIVASAFSLKLAKSVLRVSNYVSPSITSLQTYDQNGRIYSLNVIVFPSIDRKIG